MSKSLLVGSAGLVCTALGVLFRASAKDWATNSVGRQGNMIVQQEDPTRTILFTEIGLALLLVGVALVLAAALSWLLLHHNEKNAA
jgi:hypothetical protein